MKRQKKYDNLIQMSLLKRTIYNIHHDTPTAIGVIVFIQKNDSNLC